MAAKLNSKLNKIRPAALSLLFASIGPCAVAAWEDNSAGSPFVQSISAKEMGADGQKWITLQDQLGRLFVGGAQLHMFDGQAWQTFTVGDSYCLRALAFGRGGRLWAGAINEVGYFDEESVGVFKYHSLLPSLPKDERLVGDVWSCSVIGKYTYFVCRDRLLRWDGLSFRIWHFAVSARLFPLKIGDEYWFHHVESGLYKIVGAEPKLIFPASDLPETGILGLARDERGLVLASASGFFRPGRPPSKMFSAMLNLYVSKNRLSSLAVLPSGDFAIGTINAGIALAKHDGQLIRILDTADGLPSRSINSIYPEQSGAVWCTTSTGIFCFEANGVSTLHRSQKKLADQGAYKLASIGSQIFALNDEGLFALDFSGHRSNQFEEFSRLTQQYECLLPYGDGFLLGRLGGVDLFREPDVTPVVKAATSIYRIQSSTCYQNTFYLFEQFGLSRLSVRDDGSFFRYRVVELPANCESLHEDAFGRLWIGTTTKGAFIFDEQEKSLAVVRDPVIGAELIGPAIVTAAAGRILILYNNCALQARLDGTGLRKLSNIPRMQLIDSQPLPDGNSVLVAFKHPNISDEANQSLGVIGFSPEGDDSWIELDVPALKSIGFIRDMEFSEENTRPVLWVGGAEGLLRLDYNEIPPIQPPKRPLIFLNDARANRSYETGFLAVPYRDHRISLRTFAGDYARGKDWMFQTRIEKDADWSAPSTNRTFEFTNLSEGSYSFEVRAVNSANLISDSASFAFTILPPWYRSNWAYTSYVAGLGAAVFGFIRIRDRRTRNHNRELAAMVEVRTAELVKANAAKDEFLASISHEIRNPMNGVLGIAESFRTDALDLESRHKFGLLRQCASHLSSLLEDILDFARVQAGVEVLEAKSFDLRELVGSIAAITAADSERFGIPVETAVSPLLPQLLTGDARRVRQILLNFVGNALKYAGRGRVRVTVWGKTASSGSAEIFFAVSDEGPGIRPEDREKLFTRFERGRGTRFGRVPGSGLGLALCKVLAEKMGGRVWLESEIGEGSCFIFSAPFAFVEGKAGAVAGDSQSCGDLFKTALVVDDEEYNRIALTGLLEAFGLTVHAVGGGEEAKTVASNHDFDLIFLDFALPGKSGPEVAREIRRLPSRTAHAVIFAVTAFNTPDKRAQCLAAGMNAFLSKPVTMDRLRQSLSAIAPLPPPTSRFIHETSPTEALRSLHLVAAKKQVPFADELARYLADLESEYDQLTSALQNGFADQVSHYAHLLRGRCAFIHETELDLALDQTGAASADGRWEEARQLGRVVRRQLDELRLRLASPARDVRPGSSR